MSREPRAAIEWTTYEEKAYRATLGELVARVWYVGGELPWRSILESTVAGVKPGRVISHWKEEPAKRNLEKKLRAASKAVA